MFNSTTISAKSLLNVLQILPEMIRLHLNDFIAAHVENSLLDKTALIMTKEIYTEEDAIVDNSKEYNGEMVNTRQFQSSFLDDYDFKPRLINENEVERFTDYLLPLMRNQIVSQGHVTEQFDYEEILNCLHKQIEKFDYFNGFYVNDIKNEFNFEKLLTLLLDEEYSQSAASIFSDNNIFEKQSFCSNYKASITMMANDNVNSSLKFNDFSKFASSALYSLPLSAVMTQTTPVDINQKLRGLSNVSFSTQMDLNQMEMNYFGVDSKKVLRSIDCTKNDLKVTYAFPHWFKHFKVENTCQVTYDIGIGEYAHQKLMKLDPDTREYAYDVMDLYQIKVPEE